jgi:lactoylglutathione lyase
MKIDHIAIWSHDIEKLKKFYIRYFNASAGEKYCNHRKNFQSYFLSFDSGCRLEIMEKPGVLSSDINHSEFVGLNHFAIGVGSKAIVDSLTETLRNDGYEVAGEPRTTGDGYYESIVLDPDGNRIEITI